MAELSTPTTLALTRARDVEQLCLVAPALTGGDAGSRRAP